MLLHAADVGRLSRKCDPVPVTAGLYRHLGMLFYKYLGCADVTFKQLYEAYGVELAVSVTNISRECDASPTKGA